MVHKTDRYRLHLYETFAHIAKDKGLRWVVAHGSEGYPQTIGRDLDVLCDGVENINLAVSLFKEAASLQPTTKWIIDPHPIWGKRVLAISQNYEVAELHILYKLNSGLLDCKVDWNKVSDELFPKNNHVTYFKSVIMPLLGGSAKTERFSEEDIQALPGSLRRLYSKNTKKQHIAVVDKLFAYLQLGGFNINRMYHNYIYSKTQTADISVAATTPVALVNREQLKDIEKNLNEIFLKIVCGDLLSLDDINYHQSRQRLVFLSSKRNDVKIDVDLTEINEDYLDWLVETFYSFNQSKSLEYKDYIKHRIESL